MKSVKYNKVAVFGGSFNPVHKSHLNIVLQAQKKFNFDQIKIVPVFQNPFDSAITELPTVDRLEMLNKVFNKYSFVEIDDQEIKRKGISYTVDTVKAVNKNAKEVFLIIGMDQFVIFDQWKNYEQILKKAQLLVFHRADVDPKIVNSNILKKFYKKIHYMKLNNMEISSSDIRQRLQKGLPVGRLLPPGLKQWLLKKSFYSQSVSVDSKQFLKFCEKQLLVKQAEKIKIFDLSKKNTLPFNFTLVASGLNIRHTKVLAKFLQKKVQEKFAVSISYVEGQENGEWIVLDYGDIIIHIFYDYTRDYYSIENLWDGCSV